MSYYKHLKVALDEAKPATGFSVDDLNARIAAISEELRWKMGDTERIMLCAERRELRLALAAPKKEEGI